METFKEASLKPEILRALEDLGFEKPTPIQKQVLEQFDIEIKDCIALAQTGTGKTAAFSLPILNTIESFETDVQAIILSPTRELALQISNDIHSFSKYQKGISNLAVYGGTSIMQQIRTLRDGPQIIVGTPGRTKDLINRKKLKLDNAKWIILDEADEMLNMGFKDDIEAILQQTPEHRRTLMFSATMPREVADIAKNYLFEPVEVTIGKRNESTANVQHHFYLAASRDRYSALRRIVDVHPDIYGMVFCRTRAETKDVADRLAGHGYNADALHGDLSQSQRDYVMDKFRRRTLQILVATDVAARGIDVDNLTHVINYNLPDDAENYTHRSGRTGRAGNEGISIAIIHSREFGRLREIERIINKKFEQQKIPGGWEICQSQLMHYFDKVQSIEVNENTIGSFIPAAMEKLGALDKEELIKKVVAHEFQHLLNDYRNAPDLNIEAPKKEKYRRDGKGKGRDRDGGRSSRDKRGSEGRHGKGNWERMTVDIGSTHQMNPAQLIGIINKALGNRNSKIGKIKIGKKESQFEVELMESISLIENKKLKHRGKKVNFYKS